jgi:uncharacterized protein (DUF2141 family)
VESCRWTQLQLGLLQRRISQSGWPDGQPQRCSRAADHVAECEHTAATSVTFDNVAAGSHALAVMMSGSNHISVNPPVAETETFTAR